MTTNTRKPLTAARLADIECELRMPRRTYHAFDSLGKVREAFRLPVTMGAPKEA